MSYKKIQFIAYEICTAPLNKNGHHEYLGIDDEKTDVSARVELFRRAFNEAFINKNTDHSRDVLKIFMMPEFFFRGAKGAYAFDTVTFIVENLQRIVMYQPHWLFVFGTIVAQFSNTPIDKMDIEGELPEKTQICNYTLVQKGNFTDLSSADKQAHIVMKEYLSPIDFIHASNSQKRDNYIAQYVEYIPPMNKTSSEIQKTNYDGASVFNYDNIIFGLEVCLDHAKARLKNSQSKVYIQLITSCGMSLQPGALAVENGGYVFLCDGYNNGVQVYQNDGNPNGNCILDTKRNPSQPTIKVAEQSISVSRQQMSEEIEIKKLYPDGAGQVWICPPYPNLCQPIQSLSITKSVFPRIASGLTVAFSEEPILLNGMKVLFDNPVPTTPITLQPK